MLLSIHGYHWILRRFLFHCLLYVLSCIYIYLMLIFAIIILVLLAIMMLTFNFTHIIIFSGVLHSVLYFVSIKNHFRTKTFY